MKRLLLLLVLCAGCGLSWEDDKSDPYYDNVIAGFKYSKDPTTGICYAIYGKDNYLSMTCVPCDSLKRIKSIVK